MQLSKQTIDLLKNFSTINSSIVVQEGSKLATMNQFRSILAEAKVAETFPQEFAIYNLNEFLAAHSLFSDPELHFEEKWVIIREKGAKRGGIKYFFSNKSLIVHPTKSIKFPEDPELTFTLKETDLIKMQKAAAVLGVADVVVVSDEEGISIVVRDRKNDSSNDFQISVSDEPQKNEYKFYLKQENLKLTTGDYKVQIAAKGIAMFQRADGIVSYGVALEAV